MPGGRPPKPTALKVLQGNPGKRKLRKDEPKPTAIEKLDPPEYLSRLAKEEWLRVAPEVKRLGLLTLVDVAGLAGYCQAYARWREAIKATNECTLGEAIARGFVKAEKEALAQMVQLAQQFGFTPSSRSKVAGAGKPADEEDPLREFELHNGGKR
jgi:P27 family predicted phage terminase small subunit